MVAMTRMAFLLGTPWSCARFPPESGHSSAAPLRPNKGIIHVLASEYDSNQFTVRHTVRHFAVARLPANIVACADQS
jgi:hypothetical protein